MHRADREVLVLLQEETIISLESLINEITDEINDDSNLSDMMKPESELKKLLAKYVFDSIRIVII